jgi:hypothetical protein
MEEWNITWLGMLDTTPFLETSNPQEYVISQSMLILMEKIFQDISKQMLETSYTLNLGQLLKMVPKLKRYIWYKMKLDLP